MIFSALPVKGKVREGERILLQGYAKMKNMNPESQQYLKFVVNT